MSYESSNYGYIWWSPDFLDIIYIYAVLKHDIKWRVDGNWEWKSGIWTHWKILCISLCVPYTLPVNITVRENSSYFFYTHLLVSSTVYGAEKTLVAICIWKISWYLALKKNTFLWLIWSSHFVQIQLLQKSAMWSWKENKDIVS